MSPKKITPMIQQYLSIKENHADSILFYRMGDFYEMFFEDARIASKILEITLTARNKKEKFPVPMCGVPVKAAKGYIAKLIASGQKVAICEQIEDAAQAKGLVKRDVIRVISPGMIIENDLLNESANNYLQAIDRKEKTIGISFLDISTGDFRIFQTDEPETVMDELLRISPSEILINDSLQNDPLYLQIAKRMPDKYTSFLKSRAFDYSQSRQRLMELFNTRSLEGFGCEHLKAGVGAAGALVYYIKETQKQDVAHFSKITPHWLNSYLLIDDSTSQNLELIENMRGGGRVGTLLGVMDKTVTSMGARLMKRWIRYPLIDAEKIISRQNAVGEAKENPQARDKTRKALKSVYDFERLGSKISMGHANARDLSALKRSIQALPDILSEISVFDSPLYAFGHDLTELFSLGDLLEKAIRDDAPPVTNEGNMIRRGYDEQLDELDIISRDGKTWLLELEAREKAATGISSLKVRFNRVFGYYIEVSKAQSKAAPLHYIRKQTLVNAERYITDELKSFESKALGSQEQKTALEYEIFQSIRQKVAEQNQSIFKIARFLAEVDCLSNMGEIAAQNDYNPPEINQDGIIEIIAGRHPVVEENVAEERFVPNDIRLDDQENQILILTGPNMAGKSTILRQTAILTIMAQIGSFVPADKASISITDRIFSRVGALDNLSAGQSTFMVEMEETANIINNATAKSLIIMDEIGRGTSTFDGLSIAWAVAEHLHNMGGTGVKTLFATHYHELTELSRHNLRVKNFNIAVKEWNDEIVFLRKLVPGGTNRSYGIQVARLAGLPDDVIRKAKQILSDIENGRSLMEREPEAVDGAEGEKAPAPEINLAQENQGMVIERLMSLDISRLTPLDALNCLDELKKELMG